MPTLRISKTNVDAAPVSERGDAYYWDDELRGFGLRVTPRGVRSYVIQYRLRGRPARRMTLGLHGSPWTPAKAREEAGRLLIKVKQGQDPVEIYRQEAREAQALAFEDYADRFVRLYLKTNWRDSWAEGQRIVDKNLKPHFKKRSLASITRADVAELLDRYADRPAMARHTYAVLRKLFRWAVNRGDIARSPIAEMRGPRAVPSRQRVLTHEELACAWLGAGEMGYPWGPVIRLLITTLQRRDEVAGMAWPELNLPVALWDLPPARVKNDEGHRVPLNALALRELEALKGKRRGFVFTTTGKTAVSGFSDAKEKLNTLMLKHLRERAASRGEDTGGIVVTPWRFHDLRRTGATNLQALGIPVEVTEDVLNHVSGTRSGVAGTYNRHRYEAEKRRALDLWSDKLDQILQPPAPVANLEERRRA